MAGKNVGQMWAHQVELLVWACGGSSQEGRLKGKDVSIERCCGRLKMCIL